MTTPVDDLLKKLPSTLYLEQRAQQCVVSWSMTPEWITALATVVFAAATLAPGGLKLVAGLAAGAGVAWLREQRPPPPAQLKPVPALNPTIQLEGHVSTRPPPQIIITPPGTGPNSPESNPNNEYKKMIEPWL